ncbi:hypothetical protein IKW72_07870 [bacterium]|nr:hypothetical protein [bacterium]
MKVVATLVAIIAILAAAGLGYKWYQTNGELKNTQAKLTKCQQEVTEAKAAKEAAEQQTADIQAKLTALETAKKGLEEELAALKAKYEELTANIGSEEGGEDALNALQTTISDLKSQVEQKETELKEAQDAAESLKADIEAKEKAIESLKGEVASAKEAQQAAEKQANSFKMNLLEHGLSLEEAPVFAGEILAVNPAGADYPASYILSVGKGAGLPVGQELKVTRGTTVIGTLKVVRIYDDQDNLCGAESKDLIEGQIPQVGDKVNNEIGLKNN